MKQSVPQSTSFKSLLLHHFCYLSGQWSSKLKHLVDIFTNSLTIPTFEYLRKASFG